MCCLQVIGSELAIWLARALVGDADTTMLAWPQVSHCRHMSTVVTPLDSCHTLLADCASTQRGWIIAHPHLPPHLNRHALLSA